MPDGPNLIARVLEQGKDALPEVLSATKSNDSYVRSLAALALGYAKCRESFNPLLDLLKDDNKHVRFNAVLGLGYSGDSRATFVLINYFDNACYETKVRVVQALQCLADPRAACFLFKISGDFLLENIASRALQECSGNTEFAYSFIFDDSLIARAQKNETRFEIRHEKDLNAIKSILDEHRRSFSYTRPQTYVVTLDEKFFIGGMVEEHVFVAKGEDVLAAGEVLFEKSEGVWRAVEINNMSNGYFPDPSCFYWVKKSLSGSGIILPTDFTWKRTDFWNDTLMSLFQFYKYHYVNNVLA